VIFYYSTCSGRSSGGLTIARPGGTTLVLVPGMFLIGGTFKSPELNAFPKLELLKTLLSFSRPWVPTSISAEEQFVSATPNKFIE
jgi:hypothetical protein